MTEEITEIKRYEPENPYNYTKVQLAERKKALKDIEKDYPNLPYAWIEMIYDWEYNTPKEEVERIINSGEFEVPSKFTPENVKLTPESEKFNKTDEI